MPDVARHAGEKDVGVTAFEPAHHRHFGNAVALPEIFAQEEGVDPGGVAAHDHVLVVVGKNLRLDEVARAEEIGHGARLAHSAESAFAEELVVVLIGALQFLAGKRRDRRAQSSEAKVLRDIDSLEAGERAHPNVVELREQKGVDEMPAIDRELRVVDRFLRDLEPRRARTEEAAASAPIEFRFRFARPGDEKRQIETEKIVALDHVGIAFLDQTR